MQPAGGQGLVEGYLWQASLSECSPTAYLPPLSWKTAWPPFHKLRPPNSFSLNPLALTSEDEVVPAAIPIPQSLPCS